MARKRMIDPDFWTDEALGQCKPIERLLFMGLISQADDSGRLRGTPSLIRSQVFPYDDTVTAKQVAEMLAALATNRLILRYEADGQQFIWVRSFSKHQSINKPTESKLPPPPVMDGSLPDDYGSTPVALHPKRREEKLREEKGMGADADAPPPVPERSAQQIPRDALTRAVGEAWFPGVPWERLTITQRKTCGRCSAELFPIGITPEQVIEARQRWDTDPKWQRNGQPLTFTPDALSKYVHDLIGATAPSSNGVNGAAHQQRRAEADEIDRLYSEAGIQPNGKPFGPAG